MRKKTIWMIGVALAACMLLPGCGFNTGEGEPAGQKKTVIVTSFYPMYIMTMNVIAGVPGVELKNLTPPQTGCLHDYQLTPDNMKTLEVADILIINGAGMESFMDSISSQNPNVKVVDASQGCALIVQADGQTNNPHLWVSISGAIEQTANIGKQLAVLDPANAARYQVNADSYIKRLEAERSKMHSVLDPLPNRKIVTFHEAFPYFAREFQLSIVATVEREPGSEPSAAEMAATVEIIRESGAKFVFVEPQYSPAAAQTIAREAGASVLTLDPAVSGPDDPDAYIRIMDANLEVLREAMQ